MSAPSHGPAYQALAITPSPGSRGSFRGRQSNGPFLSKAPSVSQAPSEARVPNLRSPNGCKKICDTNLRQLRGSECLTSANHDTPIYSANKRDTSTPKKPPPNLALSHLATLPPSLGGHLRFDLESVQKRGHCMPTGATKEWHTSNRIATHLGGCNPSRKVALRVWIDFLQLAGSRVQLCCLTRAYQGATIQGSPIASIVKHLAESSGSQDSKV